MKKVIIGSLLIFTISSHLHAQSDSSRSGNSTLGTGATVSPGASGRAFDSSYKRNQGTTGNSNGTGINGTGMVPLHRVPAPIVLALV